MPASSLHEMHISGCDQRGVARMLTARATVRRAVRLFSPASSKLRRTMSDGGVHRTGLPAPTGLHPVGCVDLMQEPGLLVRLYYPTQSDSCFSYKYAPWLSHADYGKSVGQLLLAREPDFLSSPLDPAYNCPTFGLYGAPLLRPSSPTFTNGYPVVVFSHGLNGCRLYYSSICTDLASHGYMIAAVEHKDRSACTSLRRVPGEGVAIGDYERYVDEWITHNFVESLTDEFELRNRQVKQRSQEVTESLDLLHLLNGGGAVRNMMGERYDFRQFAGCLDLSLAAVAGHSFGAATTLIALSNDARFKCAIVLDVWTFPIHDDFFSHGLNKPVIFINSYIFSKFVENLESIHKLLRPPNDKGISSASLVTIKGTLHLNQCDFQFAIPNISKRYRSRLDKYIASDVNLELCHSFLKRFLLKDPSYQGYIPTLDGGSQASEHIMFHSYDKSRL